MNHIDKRPIIGRIKDYMLSSPIVVSFLSLIIASFAIIMLVLPAIIYDLASRGDIDITWPYENWGQFLLNIL